MENDKIPVRRCSITGVDTVEVFNHELDSIEKESLDVGQDLQFGSIAASVAVTLLVSLALTEIQSPTRYACFFAALLVSCGFALYFFVCYFRKRGNFQSTIQKIRARQVGPVGEQGREMRAAEVAQLPVIQVSDTLVLTDDVVAAAVAETPPRQTGEQK